jgi:predicted O-methyltransferase YrrM
MPWIAYNAIERLERLLQPDWDIVEFGSGMSTSWYAARVGSVHSIESDPVWYMRLVDTLPSNVRYELRDLETYPSLADHENRSLDMAIIDGNLRSACVRAVIPKIRARGWIFLDNADRDMTIPNGDMRQAEAAIRQAATHVETETGLIVGMLAADEWLLAQLP